MKNHSIYGMMALAALTAGFTSCDDDKWAEGAPAIDVHTSLGNAHFGDSLAFSVRASDPEVALSTLKATLFFGEEQVSETVIRTKQNGADYEGKIYIPYMANIPDGRAVLRMRLQNVNFTTTEQTFEVHVTHADYPSLQFVATDGTEYTMERTEQYCYSFTDRLPQELKGHIVAPKLDDNGNEITFGWGNGAIVAGAADPIPFSNSSAGKYTVSFNTYSLEGSPFTVLTFNGRTFSAVSETVSAIDMTLTQGQTITPAGFPEFDSWWIDPDWLTRNDDGTLTFVPMGGTYRFEADMARKYFRVYTLSGSDPATLDEATGTGAVWVIGDNVGKPSLSSNTVGWTTEKAICMAPVAEKVYRITLIGGKTVGTDAINFKFFGQMGWGFEFGGDKLTSTSSIVKVGTGEGGHDNGNLYLEEGKTLEAGHIYTFTVDLTAGTSAAVLSVTDDGEQPFEEQVVRMGGEKMTTLDNEVYTLHTTVAQGAELAVSGISDLDEYYADPDYFTLAEGSGAVGFNAVDGEYLITLNRSLRTIAAKKMNGDAEATLAEGAIWMMGWGVGSPSLDSQFGWNPGQAYCVAQVAPGVYQFTGQAGPEHGSSTGMRLRTDYLSFKFFHQNGWGGEFAGDNAFTLTDAAKAYVKDAGNIELADGVQLEEGATYRITINLNGGGNGTLDMVKL
ncbi:MAG: DUF5121 domain-containing protein [Muribaculaceae bacterium]|nr:DUF5121 domain-containing protein [Muribaculaceae bacterium]